MIIEPSTRELVVVLEGQNMDPRMVQIHKDINSQNHDVSFIRRDSGLTILRTYTSYEKAEKSGQGWLDGTYNPEQ